MRVVIDLQGAQTESRFRGVGRYSLSLAKAIIANRGEHEILIALNGLFPETIEPIRAAFEGRLPQENIRVWYAPCSEPEREPEDVWSQNAAERVREAFLSSLKPDIVLLTSLFEGFYDNAVTSIGTFDQRTPTVVVLHDLIPVLNPEERYLHDNPEYERYYLKKVEYLKRASAWLANSESTAKEGVKALGLSSVQMFTISAACDDGFKLVEILPKEKAGLLKRFGISRPFIMHSGGGDIRKNLARLIRAYGTLSPDLRSSHQLVLACKFSDGEIQALRSIAAAADLSENEMILTGYVSDEELVRLYNLCKLFIFTSWHEEFGLATLEAMACGAPVIAGNSSGMQELIGRNDVLFDAQSEFEIASKIKKVLTNKELREELGSYGLQRARMFSLDECARKAIKAMERVHTDQYQPANAAPLPTGRPRLAYLSPLPPERSGISDYSAELLPELARYYDIEVIVAQQEVSDPWIAACLPIRSSHYFTENANRFDRVLYHIGNSAFHKYMFDLLDRFPGVVVMHDFYLGNIKAHIEISGDRPGSWTRDLYDSHGYNAVNERLHSDDSKSISELSFKYPCNFDIIRRASGVIVHSAFSSRLAQTWYGEGDDWAIIPHLRAPISGAARTESRRRLGIAQDSFVVCSFGILGPAKQNHRLLNAWLESKLSGDPGCELIFVGDNHGGEYGRQLIETIQRSGLGHSIHITGWVNTETFKSYLAAADIAVQLRASSRGETSGTILDCMNFGLPAIVNAHASIAELPKDALVMLSDDFSNDDLIKALEDLWKDANKREEVGERAREAICALNSPAACAKRYAQVIESIYDKSKTNLRALIDALVELDGLLEDEATLTSIAASLARNLPRKHPAHQILVDVSALSQVDLMAGTERVTRCILKNLLLDPPVGYRVEPVYATSSTRGYCYARRFTLSLLECSSISLPDDPVEYHPGDIFLGLDLNQHVVITQLNYLQTLRDAGVEIFFVVYDLLPILLPEAFPPQTNEVHNQWLESLYHVSDGVICISRSVADEVAQWLRPRPQKRPRSFKIEWFHMGADIEKYMSTRGIPDGAQQVLAQISARPSFLMVGTIEPRKGYLQAIEAFEQLWRDGIDANLVIVGKEGWKALPGDMRRTIPEIINRLKNHPEIGRRLLWLDNISDEYLEKIYEASTCLIAASEGEGFGLPLIEAAQHKLPIIARDIPVFREVAGEHSYYFDGEKPSDLAGAIVRWLELFRSGHNPRSDDMPWLTWSQSARMLLEKILPRPSDAAMADDKLSTAKIEDRAVFSYF